MSGEQELAASEDALMAVVKKDAAFLQIPLEEGR